MVGCRSVDGCGSDAVGVNIAVRSAYAGNRGIATVPCDRNTFGARGIDRGGYLIIPGSNL